MLRLTSGMPASALLRSLNRLVLESSGKSSEKGEQCRLEGVGVRSFRTRLVTTPCHLAHQDSHHPCPNHPQAHSPALESVFFAVSSTSPSFAGFLPLNSCQSLETKQVGKRLGSPGPSLVPHSLWGWTPTSQQGKAELQGFYFLALYSVMLSKLSYSGIWRNSDMKEAAGRWPTLTCQDGVWEIPAVGIQVWSQMKGVLWFSGTLLHQGHLEAPEVTV